MAQFLKSFDPMDKVAEFAAWGLYFRRNNYDGTACTPQRLLTRPDDVNLLVAREGVTILDESNKAALEVRRDGFIERKLLDFSSAADLSRVKPTEVMQVLNAAGFTDMQAYINQIDGACNFTCTDPSIQFTQVYGPIAGAVGFGGGSAFHGLGAYFLDYARDDDTITATRADQRSDNTTVDQAGGGHNTFTTLVVEGERTGVQYTVNVKPDQKALLQMFEGGEFIMHPSNDPKPDHYIPPSRADKPKGGIEMYKLSPLYPANARSNDGNEIGVKVEHVLSANVTPQDSSSGANSWTSFNYLLDAGIYLNENGERIQQPEELTFTRNKWLQFKLQEAAREPFRVSNLQITPVAEVNVGTSVTIAQSRIGYNQCAVVPQEANGYEVSFEPLSTVTDTVLSWDMANTRIVIVSSITTGTETVTVHFTNMNGTVITKTFSLTVAA